MSTRPTYPGSVVRDERSRALASAERPVGSESSGLPIKDDLASMEFPLFTLAKQPDTTVRMYQRRGQSVRIIPSSVGCATVFDKDLLLYLASRIVEAHNLGAPVSRTVAVKTIDFLRATGRSDGGASFARILAMLRRLRGTTLETNIPTGTDQVTQTDGFGLIEGFRVLSDTRRRDGEGAGAQSISLQDNRRVLSFSVTLSEWYYNALLNFEVLTIDPGYFRLTRAFDRRLYEIARKHCGKKMLWKINIDALAEKIGTQQARFRVREDVRQAILADALPDYRVALDSVAAPDDVVFYTRHEVPLLLELAAQGQLAWFGELERIDNAARWSLHAQGAPGGRGRRQAASQTSASDGSACG